MEGNAELDRGLGNDDVGAGGERAEDVADILLLEDALRLGADRGGGLGLRRGIHLGAAEEMAGDERDAPDAESRCGLRDIEIEARREAAKLQHGGGLAAVGGVGRGGGALQRLFAAAQVA